MANFCIKCGFKLNDADIFCRNCGAKVKVHYSSAYLKSTIYEELEAKKILQAIKSSDAFSNELHRNDLSPEDGNEIIAQLENEISSGRIKSQDVQRRLNELLSEYKSKVEIERAIEKFFESEEIKSKIEKYNITQEQLLDIKDNVQNNIYSSKKENISIEEIRSQTNIELEKKLAKKIEIKNVLKRQEEYRKRTEARIKRDKYCFKGVLTEESEFTNMGFWSNRRVVKQAGKSFDVFLRIYENHIKIKGGKTETIFFSEITSISLSSRSFLLVDTPVIHLDLNNKRRLELSLHDDNLNTFYKTLNNCWETFKNKENEKKATITKKEEISAADELMKYAELYEKGILSEEEFNALKKKLLDL